MPRGGRRTGAPGQQYSNRTDLNQRRGPMAPTAAPGQTYGAAGAQLAAQRAVPIAPPPPPATGAPAGPAGPGAATAPGPAPIEVMPLDAATTRPGEPVTAGVPVGPGPNGVDQPVGADSDLRVRLGAMYMAFPTEEIRELIEMLDSEPS